MRTLGFILTHYSLLAALSILAYIFGRRSTLGFAYHSALERVCFSLALGLGIISYIVFLSGIVGALRRPVLLAMLAAGVILCYRVWRFWPQRLSKLAPHIRQLPLQIRKLTRSSLIKWLVPLLLGSFIVLPILLLPLYPPTAFDGTMYHLPYAKVFVEQGALVFTPHLRYAVFPQANEMLFTLALLFVDDILAQLIELLMFGNLLLALVACGARLWSARSGFWAASLLLGVPLVVWLGTVPYVDIGLTLYTTLGVYAYLIYRRAGEPRWMALAGVLCGIGFGTKYLVLPVAAMIGIDALVDALRRRAWRGLLLFVLLATLVAAPWAARNYYYTGNPIFPVLHSRIGPLIGGEAWSDVYEQEIFEDLSRKWKGKGIGTLLEIPSRLTIPLTGEVADRIAAFNSILLLVLVPVLIAGAARDLLIHRLLLYGGMYLLFWFLLARDIRFVIPALPFLFLAAAGSMELLWRMLVRRLSARALFAGALLAAVVAASPGWYTAITFLRIHRRIPATSEQRDSYLSRILPPYPIYQYLNNRYGSGYSLYAIGAEYMVYYANGKVFGDHFGPMSYRRMGLITPTTPYIMIRAQAFHAELKRRGIDHLLISTADYHGSVADRTELAHFFKLHYQTNGWMLFVLQ